MTATIHPHPRARERQAGAGYPAAFGSAAGPGFLVAAPARPASPVPLAARLARAEDGPARPALRAAS